MRLDLEVGITPYSDLSLYPSTVPLNSTKIEENPGKDGARMMKIRTTVEIVDDDGTAIATRNLVEAGIPSIDAFNNKEKLLNQFDVIEKAIIQSHKKAAEQALTNYFDEAGKKNAKRSESKNEYAGFRDRANSYTGLGRIGEFSSAQGANVFPFCG